MVGKIAFVAGMLALGTLAAPQMSSAAPSVPASGISGIDTSLVEQAHWWGRRHCRYWRDECANRWGWGTPGYYRCLWRHGCGARW